MAGLNIRDSWLAIAVAVFGAFVVAYPFTQATYPPITDLPFHATHVSILRNFSNPDYGFARQFLIRPLDAPYFLLYAIGAAFALVAPVGIAAKAMAAVALALLPAGLAVLAHGMKKSPLLGVLGFGLVWTTLSHWGFLSFLAAVGLFAMTVGCALLVLDEPTRGRRVALGLVLAAVFFTHIYRFPFALLSVGLTAIVMRPVAPRWKPLLLPVAPVVALFALWLGLRSHVLSLDWSTVTFQLGRLAEVPAHLYGGFVGEVGASERSLGLQGMLAVAAVGGASFYWGRREGRADDPFQRRATVLVLLIAAGLLVAYLMLPLTIKSWFFVYPREVTPALLFAFAALPDLPRSGVVRAAIVAIAFVTPLRFGHLVAREWRGFETVTADFREMEARVPRAPRLLYLIFDHQGTSRSTTPFIHLPAWIQANSGGSLYFHFVRWGLYPIRYDFQGGHVPPTLPQMLEWEPQRFRVLEHGPWFDTFLVRHHVDPAPLFADDPSLRLTARVGKWWLYQRAE